MRPFSIESSHFEWMLNLVDVGLHLVNPEGITIFYNEKMAEIDGLHLEQVLGKSIFALYPSLTDENSTLIRALHSGEEITRKVQTYVNLKGKRITTINSTYPLYENGRIIAALEVAKDITGIVELHDQVLDLRQQLYQTKISKTHTLGTAQYHFGDLIGRCEAFQKTVAAAKKAARTNSPVLISGATGTGKELIAQSIHNASIRRNRPFLAQNCAAVPRELMEALLFGTSKGAFTGAIDRSGLFEQAHQGTLLLDELNSLDLLLQAKLLRVLQDGIIRRVGGTSEQQVDVRIIAALNVEPREAVESGILRADLYYRLNVVHLNLLPLSERMEDIPLLVQHFIDTFNAKFGFRVAKVSTSALTKLTRYSWPGNVRELKHVMESAFNLLDENCEMLEEEHFPVHVINDKVEYRLLHRQGMQKEFELGRKLPDLLHKFEQDLIREALQSHHGNLSKAAEALGINRQALQYKVKKYNLKSSLFQLSPYR